MVYTAILSSGLKLVVLPSDRVPMVEMEIVYRFDPAGVPDGVPHLTEHLLFEGTQNIPNGDVDRWLRLAGGKSTAFTTWDSLHIHNLVSSSNLELLLYIESERSKNLCGGLTDADVENQRRVIAQELFSASMRPNGEVADRLRKKSFSNHPALSKEVLGQIYDLETASRTDVCDFAETWLHPSHATWLVTGDVDPQWLTERLEFYFSPLVDHQSIGRVGIPKVKVQNEGHRWFDDSRDSRLVLVFAAPPSGTIEEGVSDALLYTLNQQSTWEQFSSIDAIQGWSENRPYGGWMALNVDTTDPKQAVTELEDWLMAPTVPWQEWALHHTYTVARYRERNNGRVALLSSCEQRLSLFELSGCLDWQQHRFESLSELEAGLPSTLLYWDVNAASWLWMGQENWLDGLTW